MSRGIVSQPMVWPTPILPFQNKGEVFTLYLSQETRLLCGMFSIAARMWATSGRFWHSFGDNMAVMYLTLWYNDVNTCYYRQLWHTCTISHKNQCDAMRCEDVSGRQLGNLWLWRSISVRISDALLSTVSFLRVSRKVACGFSYHEKVPRGWVHLHWVLGAAHILLFMTRP